MPNQYFYQLLPKHVSYYVEYVLWHFHFRLDSTSTFAILPCLPWLLTPPAIPLPCLCCAVLLQTSSQGELSEVSRKNLIIFKIHFVFCCISVHMIQPCTAFPIIQCFRSYNSIESTSPSMLPTNDLLSSRAANLLHKGILRTPHCIFFIK